MNGHTIDRCYFLHGFPSRHKLHGKDVKPRGKKSTNSLAISNEGMPETKQFTVNEYDQIITHLGKETGNTESFINTSGNDHKAINDVKTFLRYYFKLKNLGVLKYFLEPAKFPMEQSLKLTSTEGDLLKDPTHYRRLVEKLIYLTITRPETSFSVNTLTQFMQEPRQPHINAVHRLLRIPQPRPAPLPSLQSIFVPSSIITLSSLSFSAALPPPLMSRDSSSNSRPLLALASLSVRLSSTSSNVESSDWVTFDACHPLVVDFLLLACTIAYLLSIFRYGLFDYY
ncbi:hypothetical protein EZV62_012402 [Acer yangbiense]|uniref:Uncharacterized protein n=1 Tax=Acer yangbiense TaxID=1000413 RepID=A0A5C7HWD0_9ROSI|nr:hypothetical protein EZV62_012402 [Acer yangbiense]